FAGDLDRDGAIETELRCQVDLAHAAAAESALQPVVAAEDGADRRAGKAGLAVTGGRVCGNGAEPRGGGLRFEELAGGQVHEDRPQSAVQGDGDVRRGAAFVAPGHAELDDRQARLGG